MFEKASRMKLRFAYKGQCSVEDLWDLSVEELDSIYQEMRKKQRESNTDSLLEKRDEGDRLLDLQVNIVKHIVQVKLAEAEARERAAENKLRREKIAAIMAEKQDEGLKNMSLEELQEEMEKTV